jgi:hypothetical protein
MRAGADDDGAGTTRGCSYADALGGSGLSVREERVRHLVELNLSEDGDGATYFHRDAQTGEWMENFAVPLRPTLRLAPGERVRTGVITGAEGSVLTVRWLSRPGSDSIVFPTQEALSMFLGRIVGLRGIPAREFAATTVVAYERRCDEPLPREVS